MSPVKTATMRPFSILFVILAVVLFVRPSNFIDSAPLIILDTDISSDVDDVGAVAVLHALANKEKAKILAMMVSSGDSWSAPCLDALNTWYGRPDIPIGMVKGKSVLHESKYTAAIAAEFPQDIKTGDSAPDAVALYRKILAEQQDESVVIVTIGYLTNLKNLLYSQADENSPLDGKELVRQKVKKLVCMGGQYPEGREWNLYQDTLSTEFVLKNWPAQITFSGFEVGQNIMTGSVLLSLPRLNPVRRSYQLYNGITDRPSWDQLTVLYAVEAESDEFGISWHVSSPGDNVIEPNGSNKWILNQDAAKRYLTLETPSKKVEEVVNQLMMDPDSK